MMKRFSPLLVLFLAACTHAPVREVARAEPKVSSPKGFEPESARSSSDDTPRGVSRAEVSRERTSTIIPSQQTEPTAPPKDVWQRLRDGYAFARCDASDEAKRWQRTYTRGPGRFAAMMQRALPFVLHVTGEAEKRRVPTEFVLLPIIESQYTPFASTGNRPAGMWQLMPATARGRGLSIEAGYDGRLDVYASTQVALDLIADMGERFGDWRLVNMAFNAGEYRVERALRDARARHRHPRPDQLAVSPITHEHLAKLNAVACVVAEPARFGVTLPTPTAEDHLVAIAVDAPLSVATATRLADLDAAAFRRLNPAFRSPTIARGRMMLLPAPREDAFRAALAALPASERNAVPAHVASEEPAAVAADQRGLYVVRRGDSLWRIAKQFKVSIASLLQWNGLAKNATLRPGQKLRVSGG